MIDIDDGEHKSGLTIVVSPLAETTVSGTVVLDDGRPAAEADVSASLVDHRGTSVSFTKTDSSGAFQLRVLAGMTYVIRAGVLGNACTAALRQSRSSINHRKISSSLFPDKPIGGHGFD